LRLLAESHDHLTVRESAVCRQSRRVWQASVGRARGSEPRGLAPADSDPAPGGPSGPLELVLQGLRASKGRAAGLRIGGRLPQASRGFWIRRCLMAFGPRGTKGSGIWRLLTAFGLWITKKSLIGLALPLRRRGRKIGGVRGLSGMAFGLFFRPSAANDRRERTASSGV